MAAGGMAADKDLIGSAAVFADIGVRPGESAGDILNVLRVHDARRQPIIGNHHAQAMPSPARSELAVESQETAFVPMAPSASVHEEYYRKIFLLFREIKVELVLGRIGVGALVIGHVQNFPNFGDLRRSVGLGRILGGSQGRSQRNGQQRTASPAQPAGAKESACSLHE